MLCAEAHTSRQQSPRLGAVVAVHVLRGPARGVGIVHAHGVVEHDELARAELSPQELGEFPLVDGLPLVPLEEGGDPRRRAAKADAVRGEGDRGLAAPRCGSRRCERVASRSCPPSATRAPAGRCRKRSRRSAPASSSSAATWSRSVAARTELRPSLAPFCLEDQVDRDFIRVRDRVEHAKRTVALGAA